MNNCSWQDLFNTHFVTDFRWRLESISRYSIKIAHGILEQPRGGIIWKIFQGIIIPNLDFPMGIFAGFLQKLLNTVDHFFEASRIISLKKNVNPDLIIKVSQKIFC